MDLRDTQTNMKRWLDHNFPDTTADKQLIGAFEEMGELSHAHLKASQQIRGYTEENSKAEIEDAVGDILIYLMGYCNKKGIDMSECLRGAYDTVIQRDWVTYPKTGKP